MDTESLKANNESVVPMSWSLHRNQTGRVQRAPGLVNTWRCWNSDVSGGSTERHAPSHKPCPCVSHSVWLSQVPYFIKNKQTKTVTTQNVLSPSSVGHSSKWLKPKRIFEIRGVFPGLPEVLEARPWPGMETGDGLVRLSALLWGLLTPGSQR